jgi:hypothetical protein
MNEFEAVRRLAAEPTDESVARTWYRITKLEAHKGLRPRRRVVPAVAGLAVVLVAAASLVFYRTGGGTFFPIASTTDAVAALNSMADLAAAASPQTVANGQLVRTVSEGWGGHCTPGECVLKPTSRELWYDPSTGRVVKLMIGSRDMLAGETAQTPPDNPLRPGVRMPTSGWLASLPSDPGRLLEQLRVEVGEHPSWSVDHQLWDAMSSVYYLCEVVLTPAQRAALLRALAQVSGLSVRDLFVDGVPLIAIRQTEKDSGDEIIFDPSTGRAVGRASVFLGDSVRIIGPAGGPALAPGVTAQVTWKQQSLI